MEIHFTQSFFDSLKKISRGNRWYVRVYDLFRYKLPWFFRNLWQFKGELWYFRTWDSGYNLSLFRRSLELTANNIEKNGMEIEESRDKKVVKMRRVIEILKHFGDGGDFIELAEKELGVIQSKNIFDAINKHDSSVFKRSDEIEKEMWAELWGIIKGENGPDGKRMLNGSDMRGWWD